MPVDGAVVDDQRDSVDLPGSLDEPSLRECLDRRDPGRAGPRRPARPNRLIRPSRPAISISRQICASRGGAEAPRCSTSGVGRTDDRRGVAAPRPPRTSRRCGLGPRRDTSSTSSRTNASSPPTDSRSSSMTASSRIGGSSVMRGPSPSACRDRRPLKRRGELGRSDRLADVVVHARREARIAIAGHRVGGHGHDVQLAAPATARGCGALPPVRRARASGRPSARRRSRSPSRARDRLQPVAGDVGARSPCSPAVAGRASG